MTKRNLMTWWDDPTTIWTVLCSVTDGSKPSVDWWHRVITARWLVAGCRWNSSSVTSMLMRSLLATSVTSVWLFGTAATQLLVYSWWCGVVVMHWSQSAFYPPRDASNKWMRCYSCQFKRICDSVAQADRLCRKIGGRAALFYIHQTNRVNSCNGTAMMTAPYTLLWLLL